MAPSDQSAPRRIHFGCFDRLFLIKLEKLQKLLTRTSVIYLNKLALLCLLFGDEYDCCLLHPIGIGVPPILYDVLLARQALKYLVAM